MVSHSSSHLHPEPLRRVQQHAEKREGGGKRPDQGDLAKMKEISGLWFGEAKKQTISSWRTNVNEEEGDASQAMQFRRKSRRRRLYISGRTVVI